jgi:hypothetical protein
MEIALRTLNARIYSDNNSIQECKTWVKTLRDWNPCVVLDCFTKAQESVNYFVEIHNHY